jgi:hypothetical protein
MVRRLFTPKQCSSTAGVQEETMDGAESSINFKRKMLKVIRDLTNNGKHVEANELYQRYFGDNNGKNRST